MISNMLLFAPLCFLLVWMLPVDSMRVRLNLSSRHTDQAVRLSMAEDAIDDMYVGCKSKMAEKVARAYFKRENTTKFANVWKKAESCASRKLNERDPEDQALTKNHMQAICVYTSNYDVFYKTFNDHIRNNRSIYGTVFPYHSLYFWLTSAVQILNKNTKCVTTYRRTNLEFTGEVNQKVRFGSFTSSSKKSNLTQFGKKTCFKITTCSGAYVKHYSLLNKAEEEVLIPPYELFMITDVKKEGPDSELSDCEVVYTLENLRDLSNVNCGAVY